MGENLFFLVFFFFCFFSHFLCECLLDLENKIIFGCFCLGDPGSFVFLLNTKLLDKLKHGIALMFSIYESLEPSEFFNVFKCENCSHSFCSAAIGNRKVLHFQQIFQCSWGVAVDGYFVSVEAADGWNKPFLFLFFLSNILSAFILCLLLLLSLGL